MKKIFVLCFLIIFSSISFVGAGDVVTKDFEIVAGTQTSTLGIGYNVGRKYLLAVNVDETFNVRMTTGSISAGTKLGTLLFNNGGFWEDAYFIYKSSWYFISTGTGSARISIREKD